MTDRIRRPTGFMGWYLCLLVFATGPIGAQFPKVVYEIQEGSIVTDECDCLRPTIVAPISGSFVLQRLPVRIVGELYEISAFDVSACPSCPDEGARYSLTGAGSYYLRDPETQETHLELVLNGKSSVGLESAAGAVDAPWPMIDLTVTEDGTRDPAQKLTLRIIAAPAVELLPYELVKGDLENGSGSILELICPPCDLIHPFIPLEGTLFVGLVNAVDDGFSVYRLDRIHLKDRLPDVEYAITGSGSYEEGGDIEMLKQARLTLAFNTVFDFHELRGGPVEVQPGEAFPIVDFEVEETRKNTLWYRLHLVARPSKATPFRRGDANSDGVVDIADPVHHLSWQFAGGPAPTCRDAADSDGDGVHNLTDAIFTLEYLFLGGPLPPEPGPTRCGPPLEAKFGCERYPVCTPGG